MMKKLWTVFTALPLFLFGLLVSLLVIASKAVAPRKPLITGGHALDAMFEYRMGAGFPGEVNRTHPASIEPVLTDTTNPPTAYGHPVLIDATSGGIRKVLASDSGVTEIYGILVRPYPVQQASASNFGAATIGAATPPTTGVQDALKDGYITVKVPAGASAKKDGQVYVWIAADSGSHVSGGFEAAASGGNTIALKNAKFNGTPDAQGNVEVVISPVRNA